MLRTLSLTCLALLFIAPSLFAEESTDAEVEARDGVILRSTLPSMEQEWVGQEIDLSLKKADLRDTLRTFAAIGSFNLVIGDEVDGEVTVELKGVPWDQALATILKTYGLGLEISGEDVKIYSVAAP